MTSLKRRFQMAPLHNSTCEGWDLIITIIIFGSTKQNLLLVLRIFPEKRNANVRSAAAQSARVIRAHILRGCSLCDSGRPGLHTRRWNPHFFNASLQRAVISVWRLGIPEERERKTTKRKRLNKLALPGWQREVKDKFYDTQVGWCDSLSLSQRAPNKHTL